VKAIVPGALVIAALAASAGTAISAEALPPPPAAYFNDYAGLVSASDAQRLDAKLRRFAEETSTQVVVAVFASLPSPSLEDFTVRAAQHWRVGRKDWDNGAVFFVFVGDRKMRIETGYGLEGALPDQLAGRILDEQVRPRFRAGDWTGGLEAGITALTIKHQLLPPTINYETPDPACDLDYVPNAKRQAKVDYALSNSFGFGGTNGALLFKRFAE
jgi:uncharacterized membrane protein YgcG